MDSVCLKREMSDLIVQLRRRKTDGELGYRLVLWISAHYCREETSMDPRENRGLLDSPCEQLRVGEGVTVYALQ